MEINEQICDILGIPRKYATQFQVKRINGDGISDEVNIHYLVKSDLKDPVVAHLRGIIVNMKLGLITRPPNYRSTLAEGDFLDFSSDGKFLRLATEFGQREFEASKLDIQEMPEGATITVRRVNGKTVFSTNLNLNARGTPRYDENDIRIYPNVGASHWGPNISFVESLDVLLGITEDEYNTTDLLFPVGCLWSPYCYIFYVITQSRLLDTRMQLNEFGGLTFVGAVKVWDYSDPDLPLDSEQDEIIRGNKPKTGILHLEPTTFDDMVDRIPPTAIDTPFILSPVRGLSVEEANNCLRYGVTDPSKAHREESDELSSVDVRLSSGGSVRIRYWNEEVKLFEFFHLRSFAQKFRFFHHSDPEGKGFNNEDIRRNTPNQYKPFVRDMGLAQLNLDDSRSMRKFLTNIVPVKPPPLTDVMNDLQNGKIVSTTTIFTPEEFLALERIDRERSITFMRTMIANPHNQIQEYRFLERFHADFGFLIEWILSHHDRYYNYRIRSDDRYYPKDFRTWTDLVKPLYEEASKRTDAKYPLYEKNFAAKQMERRKKKKRPLYKATRKEFFLEQLRRLVYRQKGSKLYRMFNLARHDTKTDSKNIADITAPVVPKTAFPPIKIKSNKRNEKKRAVKKNVKSTPSIPVASSSRDVGEPVIDLESMF